MNRNTGATAIHQHPLGVIVSAAVGIAVLPFWWAIGLAVVFCLWAPCETVLWVLAYRRSENIPVFIQHEIEQMPRREAPPVRFPRTWQPFVGHPRPKTYIVHHSVRSDAAIR